METPSEKSPDFLPEPVPPPAPPSVLPLPSDAPIPPLRIITEPPCSHDEYVRQITERIREQLEEKQRRTQAEPAPETENKTGASSHELQ